MAGLVGRLRAGLSERFASVWLLLSDTTNFLSRTSILDQYEGELMDMRRRLSSAGKDEKVARAVRTELAALRETLRLQGYDLTLGKLELSLRGFRNDAAIAEGFRRAVLFIGRRDLWCIAGEANHIELHNLLDRRIGSREGDILGKHYLWFRWNHSELILSGSDTESREDFEALKLWAAQPERKLALLGRFKRLR